MTNDADHHGACKGNTTEDAAAAGSAVEPAEPGVSGQAQTEMRPTEARAPRRARSAKAAGGSPAVRASKTGSALKLLRRKSGASLAELQEATGWQVHSVRGFLSGIVRRKLALPLVSEVGKQGVRRYRIDATMTAG